MSSKNDVTLTEARDAGYPTYGLDEAIKIGQAIYDLGGSRTPVKKEMLAKHLHYAESGPSFVQRIGAAKAFGLIDGRGGYSLTDLGKRYYLPTNDTDRDTAAFAALQKPPVFAKIVARFQGQRLPSNQQLGNIIHTESSVPASWKDKVASLFVKSATAISAFDTQGTLKVPGGLPLSREESGTLGGEAKDLPEKQLEEIPKALAGTHTHTLPLANQRKVTINAPLDITPAEISRIQKWVEVTLLVD